MRLPYSYYHDCWYHVSSFQVCQFKIPIIQKTIICWIYLTKVQVDECTRNMYNLDMGWARWRTRYPDHTRGIFLKHLYSPRSDYLSSWRDFYVSIRLCPQVIFQVEHRPTFQFLDGEILHLIVQTAGVFIVRLHGPPHGYESAVRQSSASAIRWHPAMSG